MNINQEQFLWPEKEKLVHYLFILPSIFSYVIGIIKGKLVIGIYKPPNFFY